MARKNTHANTTREDVAQRPAAKQPTRSPQEKKIRNIIIAVLLVLVVANVIAAIVFFTNRNSDSGHEATGTDTAQSSQGATTSSLDNVSPIIFSSEGVGVRNEAVGDVYLYFDYSCHACAQVEDLIFEYIKADVLDGKYNLILSPVSTVNMNYHPVATYAALIVADNDPDNFIAFHEALMDFFWQAYQAGDGSVVYDSDASLAAVQEMAAGLGISQDLIDMFTAEGAVDYLESSTTTWANQSFEGRDNDRIATPEIVVNGMSFRFSGSEAADLYENFLESLREGGLDV